MQTWDDFFNIVRLAVRKIDGQFDRAMKKNDEGEMKIALQKLCKINLILDDFLAQFQGENEGG